MAVIIEDSTPRMTFSLSESFFPIERGRDVSVQYNPKHIGGMTPEEFVVPIKW